MIGSSAGTEFERYMLVKTMTILILSLFFGFNGLTANIYPLKNDRDSLTSRMEILLNPDLREFTFSSYILKQDEGGLLFLAALKIASERGVKIKGIVDSRIINQTPELISFLISNNIEIYYFNPIKMNKFSLIKPINSFKKLNNRFHDKMWIAKVGESVNSNYKFYTLIGDKNLSSKYYRQSKIFGKTETMLGRELVIEDRKLGQDYKAYFENFIETDSRLIKLDGVLDPNLNQRFINKVKPYYDWMINNASSYIKKSTWKKNIIEVDELSIQLLTNNSSETTYKQILNELRSAQSGDDIYIENPYFILDPELEETLEILKHKKCKVTLITNLPKLNNVKLAGYALEVDLQKFADLSVEVHFIDNKSLITHAKLAVIGNKKVYIGSSNFDPRSLSLNSESGVLVENQSLAEIYLKEIQNKILNSTVVGVVSGRILSKKQLFGDYVFSELPIGQYRCKLQYKSFDGYKVNFVKQKIINSIRNFL